MMEIFAILILATVLIGFLIQKKRPEMTAAERMAYEEERGRLMAREGWRR